MYSNKTKLTQWLINFPSDISREKKFFILIPNQTMGIGMNPEMPILFFITNAPSFYFLGNGLKASGTVRYTAKALAGAISDQRPT